jgi:ketosteroid isomerase-like protein
MKCIVLSLALLIGVASVSCFPSAAQTPPAVPLPPPAASIDESAIRAAIAAQTVAWNRADIDGFMQGYEDSPETTFIGASVGKGYRPILERYKKAYSTPEQMGTLSFTELDVRLLPGACGKSELALVTGRFHLERTAKSAATKDDGIFSLVWRKGPQGWKIILDHTS